MSQPGPAALSSSTVEDALGQTCRDQNVRRYSVLRLLRLMDHSLDLLARRQKLSIVLIGVLAFVIGAALSLFLRMPQPRFHDEFSYLLAADTFAHGRLTNPTHPMWVHFESLHIIQSPTYASKYPPAQGLMLAAGQVIAGRPILGVWLSMAFACAATYWMLMAWVPPKWALLGGLFVVAHPTILFWSQSYWGGLVAMCGGALVLGAFRRIRQGPKIHLGLLMGLGMAILANSRPFEGLVLSLLVGAGLLLWTLKGEQARARLLIARILLPVLLVLAPTAGLMALYNLRVTHNPLVMPYMVHEAAYSVAPPFLWQHERPTPTYRHRAMADFHLGWELSEYTSQRSIGGFIAEGIWKTTLLAAACFWLWVPALPMLVIPWPKVRDRWMRFALLICVLFIVALLSETWLHLHYAAPIVGLGFVFALQTMRYLHSRRNARGTWRFVITSTLVLCAASLVGVCIHLSRVDGSNWSSRRARLLAQLNQDPERHLVIVRYGSGHHPDEEWVYNGADIDGSKVVWAREMDATQNLKLLEYFRDRRAWLLEADSEHPELTAYPIQREKLPQ